MNLLETVVNAWWADQAEPGKKPNVGAFSEKLSKTLPRMFFSFDGIRWKIINEL